MELNEYLRIFRRRWILILAATLCGVLLAGLASGLTRPTYDAHADLFIRADSEASSSYENSQFVLQRVKSYPDLVDSPQVLLPVLEELDSSLTLSELREQVSASNPAETVYVNVTASAGTPEEAATLANLVAENLRDVIRQLEGGDTTRNAAVEAFVTLPAVAPEAPSAPNTVLNIAMGLLGGLAVGLIGALVLGAGQRRIRTGGDIPRPLGVEVLGTVTESATRADGSPSPDTALQYRDLMTALLLQRNGHLPKILLLTAVGQRNSVQDAFAHQLAGFISDSGRTTCVIDATEQGARAGGDGPDQDGTHPSFSDVLLGDATVDDVVSVPGSGSSYRVAIGASAASISRMQAARRAAGVLRELDDHFDVTVVRASYDSHPLTTSTVARVAEASLVLVSYGTPVASLEDFLRELQATGVEPLGVLVVGGPRRSEGRGQEHAHLKVRTSGRG